MILFQILLQTEQQQELHQTLGGASVTGIDITAVTTKSSIAVDAPGVQNESYCKILVLEAQLVQSW